MTRNISHWTSDNFFITKAVILWGKNVVCGTERQCSYLGVNQDDPCDDDGESFVSATISETNSPPSPSNSESSTSYTSTAEESQNLSSEMIFFLGQFFIRQMAREGL